MLVFEFLGCNLYKYMRRNNFKAFSKQQLKNAARQILQSLHFLKEVVGVIHCDLKPENILFTDERCENLKVIDFGSSCFNYKSGFTYVQSRYYRAPEILLGLPYTSAVDMWSLGCILAELHTGRPLFPALDENELLEFFILIVGYPGEQMIQKAKKRTKFFNREDGTLIRSSKSRLAGNSDRRHLPLRDAIDSNDTEFIDFLEKLLVIDPANRYTPE